MVKNYKNDLEGAYIYIGSVLGRHGGYYSKGIVPAATENEQQVWKDLNQSIEEKKKIKIKYSSIGKKQ